MNPASKNIESITLVGLPLIVELSAASAIKDEGSKEGASHATLSSTESADGDPKAKEGPWMAPAETGCTTTGLVVDRLGSIHPKADPVEGE